MTFKNNIHPYMKNLFYLLKREFLLFIKNSTLRSVFLLAPIFYGLLLGFTYQEGKVEHIPVIVLDRDHSPTSSTLVEMLEDNKSIKVLKYTKEPTSIKDEVIKHQAAAVISIPENFEAEILQRKYPEIVVNINTANILTANFATKGIQATLGTLSAGMEMKALQRRGMNAEMAKMQYEPFKTNYITLFNSTSNYLIFMWPAMMAVVLQQVILLAMAVSFAEDFERKTFLKYYRKSNIFLIMLVKSFPIWVLSIFNVMVFYAMHLYFKIPLPEHIFNFILLTGLFVGASTFLGILFSVLMPNALKATQVLMVIASPAFIISGFTWPREAMPLAIQYFTDIIPLTPFLDAFKILLIQKGGVELTTTYLQHLSVLLGIYFILGALALKIKMTKMKKIQISD